MIHYINNKADQMNRGLEITFSVSDKDQLEITEALANIVGNEFMKKMDIDWRIFHVKLDDKKFFKVCFIGQKMSKLHPFVEDDVRSRFNQLSKNPKEDLLKIYREERKVPSFKVQHSREVTEEYDLWQDNFWSYL